MYDRILVPTDGSDVASNATSHAVDLARKYDADVHVLYVVNTGRLEGMSLDIGAAVERLEGEGQEYIDDAIEEIEPAGLTGVSDIRTGRPPSTILDYVDDHDIDLVVMGTHGAEGIGRRLLGSVAERVVRQSDVPVHTVPLPDEE